MKSDILGIIGIMVFIALLLSAISLTYFLSGYGMQRKELKITMDSFMSFYAIAPEKWELDEMFVSYKKDWSRLHWFAFSFNLIDTIKYERWRKRKRKLEEKQKKTDKYVARYAEAMQCIRNDINEFTRQNDALIEEVVAKMFAQDEELRR